MIERDNLEAQEAKKEVKRFTDEQKETLKGLGYEIYELTGQSIRSLRDSGRKIQVSTFEFNKFSRENAKFEALISSLSEVAINPAQPILNHSNKKTFSQQQEMVWEFSKKIAKEVKGVKAVIGTLPDYAELAFAHLDRTGQYLFVEPYFRRYVRTNSTAGSHVADVAFGRYGLHAGNWNYGERVDYVWTSPLVVPA